MCRHRTFIALAASLVLSFSLDWLDVAFHPVAWGLIDAAVCLVILIGRPSRCELGVIALFAPAWALYFIPDPLGYYGVWAVIVAQFALVAPWRCLWNRALRTPWPKSHLFDDFHLKVKT